MEKINKADELITERCKGLLKSLNKKAINYSIKDTEHYTSITWDTWKVSYLKSGGTFTVTKSFKYGSTSDVSINLPDIYNVLYYLDFCMFWDKGIQNESENK